MNPLQQILTKDSCGSTVCSKPPTSTKEDEMKKKKVFDARPASHSKDGGEGRSRIKRKKRRLKKN